MTERAFEDVWVETADGLRLYARDYPRDPGATSSRGSDDALTLLCLHGLTRNAADFEGLCQALAGRVRIVAMDQRGRGRSQYDSDPARYQPLTYAADTLALIDQLQLRNLVLVGTSMGGLVAMLINAQRPGCLSGVVLNDIGPEVDSAGLQRIQAYLGRERPVRDWQQAAAEVRRLNQVAFPHYSEAQWLQFARRVYAETGSGELVRQYDPAIAHPIDASADNAVPPDLWALFRQLRRQPLLVVRGAHSDILAPATLARMQREVPHLQSVEVPGVGHAPMLDEPEALAAIESFLQSLTRRSGSIVTTSS